MMSEAQRFSCRTYGRWVVLLVAAFAAASPETVPVFAQAVRPEGPRVFVNTTYEPPAVTEDDSDGRGKIIRVPSSGGDLQAALDTALPGDVIVLEAGATFQGPFLLPNKPPPRGWEDDGKSSPCSRERREEEERWARRCWIIVRSSAPDGSLPPPGARVGPSYGPAMPKIVVGCCSAIQTAPGAHHFRFVGIEVGPIPGASIHTLIELMPEAHDIIFDRCYIHGDPNIGIGHRGIDLNAPNSAVIDSYLSDFKQISGAVQANAINIWNGSGPFKIVNNYIEGSSENILTGGLDPTIPNLVPSDIEIRGNHFAKPLSWRPGDPAYAGTPWNVYDLLELKNSRRVLIDGNIFDYSWPVSLDGFAIVFSPRNQNGGAPWSTVEDVTFTHNIIRHATNGILMHGTDDLQPSQSLNRVLIQDNLLVDIGAFSSMPLLFGTSGAFIAMGHGGGSPLNVTINHNTAFQAGDLLVNSAIPTNFAFTNNITPNGPDGVIGSTLLSSGLVFDHNVIVGGNPLQYPPDNLFPSTLAQVGFVDFAGGDYHLGASSPFREAGTDGTDIGADIDALSAATANAISSINPNVGLLPPALSITPQILDFGSVPVGGSADGSFTITNTGGTAVGGAVTTEAPFSVASGGYLRLPPGASQTVVVRFTPTAAGGFGTSVTYAWEDGAAGWVVMGTGDLPPVEGGNS